MVSAGVTNPGRVRTHNEDAFLDAPERRLWVVADGMGGHSAGDLASAMIVERMRKLDPDADMANYIDKVDATLSTVNDDLRKHAQERNVALIGATVVAMIGGKEFNAIGWAGDSRVYRFHEGALKQMSRDHSTAQELMDTGQFTAAQLAGKQQGNTITRAVGGEPKLFLDWVLAGYQAGTQFLLCSDGLTKEVPEPKIEEEFKKNLPPKELAETLVQAAIAAGGRDNVTVLVVRVE